MSDPKPATTAVAKAPPTLADLLKSPIVEAQISRALPSLIKPEVFMRASLTAFNKNPGLAKCTQGSFMSCLLSLAQWGLLPDGRNAHLIPYGEECTLVLDYKGLVELAMRTGKIARIHADKVCDKDIFVVNRGKIEKHEVNYREPRGKAYAYYVIIEFKDGSEKAEVMTTEDVEAIRKRSRSGNNGPWKTDFDEMAKKTVFRRASKWISLSAELIEALSRDDDIIDIEPSAGAKPSAEQLFGASGAAPKKDPVPVATTVSDANPPAATPAGAVGDAPPFGGEGEPRA